MDPFRSQGYNQQQGGYNQGGSDWRGQGGMNYNAQSPSTQGGYNNWRGSGGQNNHQGGGQAQAPPNRMYVGNLLYTAQPNDVTAFFESGGFKVVNIQISIDPMTGRNPSYCFVDFESVEEAQRAKDQMNGREILGRPVKVNEGSHRRQNSNAQGLRVNSQGGGGGWNMYGGPANQNFSPTGWGNQGGGQWNNQGGQQHHPKRLYVGGLPHMDPQEFVESELQKLFQGYQVEVIGKLISPLPSQTPDDTSDRYYLFVDLVNQNEIDKAIEQLNNTQSPWGQRGPLKVGRARNNMGRKQGGGGGGGHNQYGGGYGGQMQMP